MSLLWVVVLVLIVFALFSVPGLGPWHHGYGYFPSGIGVVLVVILIVLLLSGRL